MAGLARAVAAGLPGWSVGAATLAAPGALAAALDVLDRPLVFPFFMADGWFTAQELPRRLALGGAPGLTILPPLGLMDAVADLGQSLAAAAARDCGWSASQTTLILAAHGSGRSRASAIASGRIARRITGFAEVRLGFIEEAPALQTVAADAGPRALCLPLFVARWGHVLTDVPAALAAAGFRGPCLPPIGTDAAIPAIIAGALAAALPSRA